MTRSPSYLWQNRYGYCFRIHIPQDLQNYVGKKELKRSLRTGYFSRARSKSKAMVMGGRYQQLFKWVRCQQTMGKMMDQEIQEAVNLFIDQAGDADIWEGDNDRSRSLNPEALRDKILKAKDVAREYQHAIDTDDYNGMKKVENGVDFTLGYTVDEPPTKGSPDYKLACRKASEAMAHTWNAYRKHHIERLAGVYNAVSDGALVPQQAELADEGKLLSVVIKLYTAEKQRGAWHGKSGGEIAADSLGLFKEIVGDIPMQRIDRGKISDFKHDLVLLPPNRNKVKKYRDKSIPELLEMESEIDKVFAPRTVNKHLGRVRTFFNWATDNDKYRGGNPVPKGMDIPLDPDADDKRAPYSIEDLTNIFSAEGYTKDNFSRSYMFWTPIIAVFHGMRQNEIAQHTLQISSEWMTAPGCLM